MTGVQTCALPISLTAIQVLIDRLPEEMVFNTTTVEPFIVAFQPANATASQPVLWSNGSGHLETPEAYYGQGGEEWEIGRASCRERV